MKKLILVVALLTHALAFVYAQQDTGNKSVVVYGNDHYSIAAKANEYNIYADKEPWESFTVKLTPSAFKNKQAILNLTSDKFANVKICLLKEGAEIGNEVELRSTDISRRSSDVLIDFNETVFEGMEEVLLIIYIEPEYKWTGQLSLKFSNKFELNNEQDKIIIFPNPAKDIVEIKCAGVTDGNYKIFDETGKIVITGNAFNSDFRVNVSMLKSGNYLFVLNSNNNINKSKLIVANSNK